MCEHYKKNYNASFDESVFTDKDKEKIWSYLKESFDSLLIKEKKEDIYPCFAPTKNLKVVFVGGKGGMSQFFIKFFKKSSYDIHILDKDDWSNASSILKNAFLVIISVPIDKTIDVIKEVSKNIDKETILCDLTSVKTNVVNCLLEQHKGPSLSLHPMFGPDTISFKNQVVVYVKVNEDEKCNFLYDQLVSYGARVCIHTAKEHEEAMAIIQALRHFTTYCYGIFLSSTNSNLKHILQLSSPIYHLELLMVGRLFAQDPYLYGDIIMSSSSNLELIEKYCKSLKDDLDLILNKDIDTFVKKFKEASDYFGDYGKQFLKDSQLVLESFQKIRKK